MKRLSQIILRDLERSVGNSQRSSEADVFSHVKLLWSSELGVELPRPYQDWFWFTLPRSTLATLDQITFSSAGYNSAELILQNGSLGVMGVCVWVCLSEIVTAGHVEL